jgi:hypothetical protein
LPRLSSGTNGPTTPNLHELLFIAGKRSIGRFLGKNKATHKTRLNLRTSPNPTPVIAMRPSGYFRQCHKDDNSCLVQFAPGNAAPQVQFGLFCSSLYALETKVKESKLEQTRPNKSETAKAPDGSWTVRPNPRIAPDSSRTVHSKPPMAPASSGYERPKTRRIGSYRESSGPIGTKFDFSANGRSNRSTNGKPKLSLGHPVLPRAVCEGGVGVREKRSLT